MKNRAILAVALVAALLTGGVAIAQEQAPWLHIRVTEEGDDGAKVNVNLPVSLVQVFADIAEKEIQNELEHGRHFDLDMEGHDIEIEDVRRAWSELSAAGDAEFVTVEEGDEYVKISRSADRILIEFEERDESDHGRVEVPVSVVDALLSGEGNELNIRAALDELIDGADGGEIVFVEGSDTTVRIWIE